MKKTQVQLFVLAIMALVGLALTGCLKSSDAPSYQLKPKEGLLIVKPWKISQITIPQYGNSGPDSSILKGCHTQAEILFYGPASNGVGTFAFNDKAGGCDSNAFHYGQGYWALNNTQDSLITQLVHPNGQGGYIGDKVRIMKILALDSTSLQVRFLDSMKENSNILKTITFIH